MWKDLKQSEEQSRHYLVHLKPIFVDAGDEEGAVFAALAMSGMNFSVDHIEEVKI